MKRAMVGFGLAMLAFSASGGLVGVASAQGAKPAAAPAPAPAVSAEPASTSATYGDWVLRCQRFGEADKQQKVCEVAQAVQLPNQKGPVAEIALGRLPNDASMHVTAVVPPSVSFPSSVQFVGTEKGRGTLELQWRRCLPGGCFADSVATDESVKIWRGLSEPGRIAFKDASGRDVALPVSFRGFAQALDALAKS